MCARGVGVACERGCHGCVGGWVRACVCVCVCVCLSVCLKLAVIVVISVPDCASYICDHVQVFIADIMGVHGATPLTYGGFRGQRP